LPCAVPPRHSVLPYTTLFRSQLTGGHTGMVGEGAHQLFVRTYVPPPRLLIVGAVHVTQALAPMAVLAGFEVIVIDPRRAFGSERWEEHTSELQSADPIVCRLL